MEGYINNPTTIEEFAHNAKFQCDNVSSWIYLKKYDNAMIKAKCLIEALEQLLKQQEHEKVN